MTDRDPRYTGGRIWGCIIPLGIIALVLFALAVMAYTLGAIR